MITHMETLKKQSKKYEAFVYWWDIAPNQAKSLKDYDEVEFIKKDVNESCFVSPKTLLKFLTKDRQTSRSEGNWGIKVLVDRPNELAFEPGKGNDDWLFLPVVWKKRV
jgi:hypothetical protein